MGRESVIPSIFVQIIQARIQGGSGGSIEPPWRPRDAS